MSLAEAYCLLGSPKTVEASHRMYRQLAKVHHPDSGGSHASFVRLGQAYEAVLRDLRDGRSTSRSEAGREAAPPDDGLDYGAHFEVLGLRLDGQDVSLASVGAVTLIRGTEALFQVDFVSPWGGGTGLVEVALSWNGARVSYRRPVVSTSRDRVGRTVCLAFSPRVP